MGETLSNLAHQTAFFSLSLGNVLMIAVALVLMYLAIVKEYEPLLLLPISFGMLLVNLYPPIMEEGGLLHYFFMLDEWTILPSLIFLDDGQIQQSESNCDHYHIAYGQVEEAGLMSQVE